MGFFPSKGVQLNGIEKAKYWARKSARKFPLLLKKLWSSVEFPLVANFLHPNDLFDSDPIKIYAENDLIAGDSLLIEDAITSDVLVLLNRFHRKVG
jgi:hypothetical protein